MALRMQHEALFQLYRPTDINRLILDGLVFAVDIQLAKYVIENL